jgi:hypothetical protein
MLICLTLCLARGRANLVFAKAVTVPCNSLLVSNVVGLVVCPHAFLK